jgi:hypothetical protein
MKKRFFVVLTLLILGLSFSQSQLIRSYGIKAGVAITNQTWNWPSPSSITSTISHQSLDAGVFVEWLDIPMLSVVTEIHYIQKGADGVTDMEYVIPSGSTFYPDQTYPILAGQYFTYTPQIKYLSIPILLKLRTSLGLFSPYVLAGPRFDYYLSSSGTVLSTDFNKLNVGGTFGIGLELPSFLPVQIAAEARYSPDFQDCDSWQTISVRNQSFEFLVALSF